MQYKLGELFCGPGGIALGAELANGMLAEQNLPGFEHAWAIDYHEDTCETFLNNVVGASPKSVLCKDVRTLDPVIDLKPISDIDIFAYGFPCNDFSVVGEHLGFDGEFGPLYSYGLTVLEAFQPKVFLAENVGGMRSANEGKAFKKILYDLAGCGYTLTPHLYKFEQYDVPQSRHRVVIIGVRNDLGIEFKVPAPIRTSQFVSCKDAIKTPPIPDTTPNHELTKQSKAVVERLSYIKEGQNAWTAEMPERLRLKVKGAKLSQIYKRLDSQLPSYTITGSGGGGTHVYHWEENRALTNRERARLQTFPDSFLFRGSKESIRRQIGMAVPPLGVKHIFVAVSRMLNDQDYDDIESNLQDFMG